jgi:uncharacterized protein (TIGR03083 family)
MYLTTAQCLDAIERHTRGLADAATAHLEARIEHCPDWSMADLVWHLTSVHWFWTWIATELPATEPQDLHRPQRPGDEALVAGLVAGMETLIATLRAADQDAPCWTWGLEENVRFITRHQVQEAAVHHWDALNAMGRANEWAMYPVDAIDAVDEFLTHSVGNRRWPVENAEPMAGTVWFCPCYADTDVCPAWYIFDGEVPGTVDVEIDLPQARTERALGSHGDPATLLLWLYRRVPDRSAFFDCDLGAEDRALLSRFRALTYAG